MFAHRIHSWCTLTASVALGATIGWNQHAAAQTLAPPDNSGIEVQTRGPVHEAFAETITFDPQQGMVAPSAPPAAIDEVPPSQRPEGKNMAWIPGYWGWDEERNDFLWISGIWRALPPGRQWVPGNWDQSQKGVQWTSGYWADANATETQYLPEPPASVEQGPNVAATSPDQTWLPGCWVWQQNRYTWRPGYWSVGNQDWDWTPDHYVWTPRGYIFVDGYYDYSVSRRGVAFAPVYFDGARRSQRGFSYSPSAVINPAVFANHLFLRPGYGHYYFGDYYGSNYADEGFLPWFSFQSSRRGYDPIFANQRWQHRQDRNWERGNEANFSNFRDHKEARPPRTLAAQNEWAKRGDASNQRNNTVATSLDDLARQKDSKFRFQAVDKNDQQQFSERSAAYRKFLEQRQQPDATRKSVVDPAAAATPTRRSFSKSPFVATPSDPLDVNNAPPKRDAALKSDFHVQPEIKMRGGQPGTLQRDYQGAVNKSQPQDPQAQAQLKFDAQSKSEGQGAKHDSSRGASNDQPRDQGRRRGGAQGTSQGKGLNGDQPRGRSNNQSHDAAKNPSKDDSQDKDQDEQ